ncbi:MAG: Eco57I restriction-modification methylase domain-containing protein [Dysgonamonadaceae bacterium]|nr:Eco57I restriction-modification methylase domain-containing protein [Dysgonamonadaceae bacterium]MDD4727915.1 Eco57I restriction-modification methylase domain-containing protein [Dysgonamonadaceae bacterium]
MILKQLKPRKAINKAYLKLKPNRDDIEYFKTNLIKLLDNINDTESEEHHKNLITHFLNETYYKNTHFINTKERADLVIHNGNNRASSVGVIVETKKPSNKWEMISPIELNAKAFHELLLYYLRERITNDNLEIKHLIVTNIHEWYLFDATAFERIFAQNKELVRQFKEFEKGTLSGTKTNFFYDKIAHPFIESISHEIEYTHFDIRDYEKPLRNNNPEDDNKLIALFKLLSPEHLLKLPFANDSNTLDKRFYEELLHIMGLCETKEGGKKVIQRSEEGKRNSGSMLENTINELDSLDKISRLDKPSTFGNNLQERLFNVALELNITWMNRVLFLKLLEAQLIKYHKGDSSYLFLNLKKITNYDDLNSLFFKVLARKQEDRGATTKDAFQKVPYLNSSLFEPTDLEHTTLFVSNLDDNRQLPIYNGTVLKDENGKKRTGTLNPLEYLFKFLDAYDFTSEGSEEIQEDNKTLINASVLGLIFEKINGYKDGSFFTPGFITMYMCRETIRKAVIQKFNEEKQWSCETITQLYNKIDDIDEANNIVNSLKICDPAVGSGHFLVSALNEIIAIKNDLRILKDRNGKRLKEHHVEVENDELIVTDEDGVIFEYIPTSRESQRIQEALFHEKQTIIENCLFGVDINPNSVKICRLRLWIELLKNAYYKNETELETLPNIDINIKCGNSLVSRFTIDANLGQALKKSMWTIDSYRSAVSTYRNAHDKEEKRGMMRLIDDIKNDFRSEIADNDPKLSRLHKIKGQLYTLTNQTALFEQSKREKRAWNEKVEKLTKEINKLEAEIEEIKNNKIFENAFEWRFEFPEVLNEEGDFVGFDVVIGNPPYIRQEEFTELKPYLNSRYQIYHSLADMLTYFVELSHQIMKDNGVFQFIISSKFTKAGYGSIMRKFLAENTQMTHFIDFGGKPIFDEATVDAAVIGFVKSKPSSEGQLIYREVKKSDEVLIGFEKYIKTNSTLYPIKSLSSEVWSFDSPKMLSIINKIEEKGTPLSEWDITINFGIKTGYNKAFIIDEEKKNELIAADPLSADITKPLLRGRDIQKYTADKIVNWLIGSHNGVKPDIEAVNISQYPAIKNWLDTHWLEINTRYDKGVTPYNLRNCAYWQDFNKPKLVWKRIGSILRFCYDETGAYCLDSTCIATGSKVKFLTAVLNSKLCNMELFRLSPKTGTGDLIISVQALNPIRVPIPNEELETKVCDILDEIIELKKNESDTTTLESQIDQLVYELYGLTEEEVEVVENSLNR